MRYYVKHAPGGEVLEIGTGLGGEEITEQEFNRISDEIDKSVKQKDEESAQNADISPEELGAMLMEVL